METDDSYDIFVLWQTQKIFLDYNANLANDSSELNSCAYDTVKSFKVYKVLASAVGYGISENRLKEIITQRGIKITWLASQANVERSTLNNIVANRYNTNIDVCIRIAKALDLKIDDIWYNEE
jgi:DNA-binding XRE family transcriptional regulator